MKVQKNKGVQPSKDAPKPDIVGLNLWDYDGLWSSDKGPNESRANGVVDELYRAKTNIQDICETSLQMINLPCY